MLVDSTMFRMGQFVSIDIMIKSFEKSHFRYSKCQGGELHTGELLNLVCVDQKCDHRGLICPVCKMQSHNQCHILPVKIFLAQVRDMIGGSHDPDELNNLGAYLRTLDGTKRQLLAILKEQINLLAQLYKELQVKVESTYYALRHNVLIQSTLSTKLPSLLEDLLNGGDSATLKKEFDKYCELIKYREGKPKVTDKASALVEHYKELPIKIKTMMSGSMDEYKKKLQDACKKIDTEQNSAEVVKEIEEAKTHAFVFSSTDKSPEVELNADKNEAWLSTDVDQGYACLEHTFTKDNSQINFQILTLGEDNMLTVVLAKEDIVKNWCKGSVYFQDNKHGCLAYVGSDGTSSKNIEQIDQSYEQPMFFFGAGQKLKVRLNFLANTIIFTNSEIPDQPLELPLKQAVQQKEAKLCLVLSLNDKVRIEAPASP